MSENKYVSNRAAAEDILAEQIRKHLVKEAQRYEAILQAEFRAPKSGRLYGRSAALKAHASYLAGKRTTRGGRVHRASAPGEAPAVDMAHLSKGVAYRIERLGKMDWSVVIGVTIQSGRGGPQGKSGRSIAEDLEFGTSKMAPRPGWRLALAKFRSSYGGQR